MDRQLAYLTDSRTTEFESRLVRVTPLANGQVNIILAHTYFYPTSGGQQHDIGTLNGVPVLEVTKDDDGNAVHRMAGPVDGPVVRGQIDAGRRFANMQHHSAQHILSAAVTEALGLETLSAHISAETPSTIDVADTPLTWAEVERAEQQANKIVFENRPVKIYFISDERIDSVPFRRPPKVSGEIRVVEIDGWDYSACGGTHVAQTGSVGLIKVVRTERKNQKLRLHFVAGNQALNHFRLAQRVAIDISNHFSAGLEDVITLAVQQTEALKVAQRELKILQAELLPLEAQKLAAAAQPAGRRRLARAEFTNRPASDLRELGRLLQTEPNLVAVLAGLDNNQKLSLVVSCGADTGLAARELLARLLAAVGGRGGGDARLAQGGGVASPAEVSRLLAAAWDYLWQAQN